MVFRSRVAGGRVARWLSVAAWLGLVVVSVGAWLGIAYLVLTLGVTWTMQGLVGWMLIPFGLAALGLQTWGLSSLVRAVRVRLRRERLRDER